MKIMKKITLFLIFLLALTSLQAGQLNNYRIGIDPGHGGDDPGALGPSAPHEATLCLNAGLAVRNKLQADGAPIMMTRTTNTTVSLSTRQSKFRSYDPYIALAIHLNAFNGTAHGTETWYCQSTGNSYKLATKMQAALIEFMQKTNRGVKQTCWTVINLPSTIPACLTEGLFVDNPTEHAYLCSTAGFNAWVNGLTMGCYDHLKNCVNSSITRPTTKTLSTNVSSLSFGNVVKNNTSSKTFTVSGSNLGTSITVSSSNGSIFSVSPTSLSATGGTVTVTFKPTAAQSYSGTITVSGGGLTKTVSVSGTGTELPKKITTSVTSISDFSAQINKTQQKTFTVTGTNLTSNISVSSSNSTYFSVSPTSLSASGGTVTVTFKPTAIQNYSGTITLSSTGATSVTVSLTGKGTGIPMTLQQIWNYSETNGVTGNGTTWATDPSKIRNFDYASGKLYIVYEGNKILVVNSQTGEKLGILSNVGISGGAIALADCKVIGGKIVASNITTALATSPLKVYVWDSETSDPRVLLQTNNAGSNMVRIGDCIGVKGDLTNGELYFGGKTSDNKNRVVKYTITNGVCNTTPTVVTMLDTEGNEMYFGNSVRVLPQSDGKWWCIGQNYLPSLFGTDGRLIATLNSDAMDGSIAGNAFKAFTYGGVQYGVATRYNTSGDTYQGGRFNLVDATEGWAKAVKKGEYPAAGLGTTRNTNCATSLAAAVNGNDGVEIWVSVLGQGIAYFRHGTAKTWNPGEIVLSSIAVSPAVSSLTFNTKPNQSTTSEINVSGNNLTEIIQLEITGTNADLFDVSQETVDPNAGTTKIIVTYAPTTTGNHTATLKITSEGAETKTITLSGVSKSGIVNTNVVLQQKWNFSETSGNTAEWMVQASAETRDLTYHNGALYVVKCKAFSDPTLFKVNAKTGAKIQTLDVSTVPASGSRVALASIRSLGGKLIGSNSATTSHSLKVYLWDDENSAPVLWMEDATHGGITVGDIMSVSGDLNSGRIWFSDGNKVLYYPVTNGVCGNTPTIINLTKAGAAYGVGSINGSVSIIPNTDGSFWAIGKDRYPVRFNAAGEWQEEFSSSAAVGGAASGTSGCFFQFGDKKFAAIATYLCQTATSLSEGALSLIDITGGIASAVNKGVYPSAGLGSTRNTNFNSAVSYNINETLLQLWVLIPMQGAAYFEFDGGVQVQDRPATASKLTIYSHGETLFVKGVEVKTVDIYSIGGQKVRTSQASDQLSISGLTPGVYIIAVTDNDQMRYTQKFIVNK